MNFKKNITFYIVRHGQSMGNLNDSRIIYDKLNPPLSDLGIIQSERLAERFEQFSFNRIYCSPLVRAVNTVKPLAEKNGRKVIYLAGLVEKGTSDKLNPDYPGENETEEDTALRASEVIREIISQSDDGENILISSHGTFISYIIREILGIREKTFRIKCDNASVTVITLYKDEMCKLCYLNDVRHLNPDEIS